MSFPPSGTLSPDTERRRAGNGWSADVASSRPRVQIAAARPRCAGKFLVAGDRKLIVRGVTYGTFNPGHDGTGYPPQGVVQRDFTAMAASGFNTVRTYTVPPRRVLDEAERRGLWVLVGLTAEGMAGDLPRSSIVASTVADLARRCAGHPALLGYAVANEIPAPLVRFHGRRRIEAFIRAGYEAVKDVDPEAPVTYVNYPTTEYLDLPFLDMVCFNVYLEEQPRLAAYLARLQNLAGNRPLLMAEVGLDSMRNGEDAQAESIDWQVRTAFAAGCAGAFVYSWTDEWYRGGAEVDDWAFGLTRRDRTPKPALAAASRAMAEAPFPAAQSWPRVSVIVCTYNGSRTIRQCLDGCRKLEYPDFEVVVINDGSTDHTESIVREYESDPRFRVITTEQSGLSNARNTGLEAASGEIVAYLDDDAWPDQQWLTYLAMTFKTTEYAAVGGPNIPPGGNGLMSDCIARAPGGPVHVLLTDTDAEHIPGCNMAFRRDALRSIGGFDTRFRVAGDDVDVCWRISAAGMALGYSPAAMVWHHNRSTLRAYWKQQFGYGRAEAMLEVKWPEKYNVAGHVAWEGRVYGNSLSSILGRRARVYHGVWGSAPFQSIYQPAPGPLASLSLMPEWFLIVVGLALLSALGILWTPLLAVVPLLLFAAGASIAQAGLGAARAWADRHGSRRRRRGFLTCWALHLIQPLARLHGRLRHGLTPWRRRSPKLAMPRPQQVALWSMSWRSTDDRLRSVESSLNAGGACVVRGGTCDRWDLEARGGALGAVRVQMALEHHVSGQQLVRFRSWPRVSQVGVALIGLLGIPGIMALGGQSWAAGAVLVAAAALLSGLALQQCAAAAAAVKAAIAKEGDEPL